MIRRILIFVSLTVFSAAKIPEPPTEGAIDFYYAPGSPPSRAVWLTAKLLKLDLVLHRLNLLKDEHKSEEYLKINYEHKVPYLVDEDGKRLRQSYAINIYLAQKYGEQSKYNLYPTDIYTHALINERLFTDASDLQLSFAEAYYPLILEDISIPLKKKEKLDESMRLFDLFLSEHKFAGGNDFSVADCSFIANVTTMQAVNYDFGKYENVVRWLKDAKKVFTPEDYEEANDFGVRLYQQFFTDTMKEYNRNVDGDYSKIENV